MFKKKLDIDKMLNPLDINKNSMIEFNLDDLKDMGFLRFRKIIQMDVGKRSFTRYLLYSQSEEQEFVLEVFTLPSGQKEVFLYEMIETIPFTPEFLEVVGQKYLTTPEGDEYERCIMSDMDCRIDGTNGSIKVYDLESEKIERQVEVEIWDYQREAEGYTEFLNIEMLKENGMFRIFVGQMLEDVFYKVYQGMDKD